MVLTYSDNIKNHRELLNIGRKLADEKGEKLTSVLLGKENRDFGEELIKYGADRVIVTNPDMEGSKAEETTDILHQVIRDEEEELVLVGSTKSGKEIAPRLAAKMDAGSASDASKIYFKESDLYAERVVYSGNAVALIKFNSAPALITVPVKAYDPLPKDEGRTGEVIEKDTSPGEHRSKTLDVQKMKTEGANVEDAEIIVSCGRGFKNSGDIQLIKDLADVLNGTTLGCSRPIAADLKWMSEDHWIGLSGHKVKPKLYVACGISGQVQHIAGMRDSGIIVAINKDPDAPIFKSSDYGIVGDLYNVIPKLKQAIKDKM